MSLNSFSPDPSLDPRLDNPLGTDGFEFVEFTGPDPRALGQLFEQLGFTAIARHRRKRVTLYRQGDINFIVNAESSGHAARFGTVHGPSANAMAFRVRDAGKALEQAVARGARAVSSPAGPMELNIPAIEGIGGSLLYLVDRYGAQSIYDVDFEPIDSPTQIHHAGLTHIDHLTHNLFRGQMDHWRDFYARIFNFREVRFFDIEGKHTGLVSRAMASPCGKIRIPLNESSDNRSQIEEFLTDYGGEGIQHIALASGDIHSSVEHLRRRGVVFQDTPDTYFEGLDARIVGHGHDVARLRDNRVLLDGSGPGDLLLQIFTSNAIGPIFFEIIERQGNDGFGEGNFQALFESIELDQIRRGVLAVEG